MATFQTASLLNIIEQGQKIESVFVGVLMETAMKLSSITDANILVVVDTSHGRKWVGRRSLKEEFVEGRLKVGSKDEEIIIEGVPNTDPSTVASFGEELIMGGLNLTASSASPAELDASSKIASKSSPVPSTPINFSTGASSNRQSTANLSAPLSVKTSPMPNESMADEPASSSATSVSMDSAFKENNFNTTKLVGSQKRKRRASQTSMQEKKLRCESVEREGKRENDAFSKGPEMALDAASSMESSSVNASRFLEDVAKKFHGGGGAADYLESQRQQESPRSDAEVSDLFSDGVNNNNNNYDSKTSREKSLANFSSSEMAGKDSAAFASPLGLTGEDGGFLRHASPSPQGETFEGLEPDAATLGANFFQEQIRTMLRADMSIEEISYHLKVPPSIVNYWTQLMSAMPSMKDGESSSDKMARKSLPPANNNYGHSMTGGPSEEAMAKSTPGRRSGKLDKHSLKQLIDSNKSIREIADILGVHPTTVYRAMKAYDLSLPGHNTTPTGSTGSAGSKGTSLNVSAKSPMAMTPYANVESQQRRDETPTAPPTVQRVRLKKDRLQLLKTLILSGATVRECANILGVHHTTIYRAMRNLNIDAQATQPPKAPVAGPATTSITPPGLPADLAAELAAGSSLLQHFPSLTDASQMRRWMDPATAAAAAAANYMGGMGSLADVYNQAAFRDLTPSTAAALSTRGSALDYLTSFPPRSAGNEDDHDLNEDSIENEFEPEERRESPMAEQEQSLIGGVKSGETQVNQKAETQSVD